jgi:hypothetical protein
MSEQRRVRQQTRMEFTRATPAMRYVVAALSRVRAFLPHPAWGIGVATFLSFSGRSELTLRAVGLLLVVICLALDFWAWLLSRKDMVGLKYQIGPLIYECP